MIGKVRLEYNSGLQVYGSLTNTIKNSLSEPIYYQFTGPTELQWKRVTLIGHGTNYHSQGFGSPVGKIVGIEKCLSYWNEGDFYNAKLIKGSECILNFTSGVIVKGTFKEVIRKLDRNLILSFENCLVTLGEQILFDPSWGTYDMAVGSTAGEAKPQRDLYVVLTRPEYSRNVGSAARAAGNMGALKLIIIDPKCETYNSDAREGAAGAQKYLETREEFSTWQKLLETYPEGIRIAFTSRHGKNRPTLPIKECLHELQNKITNENKNWPLFLVFGPEAAGLVADDIEYCHYSAHLPIYGDFKSLNLSQAVLLALFIVNDTLENRDLLALDEFMTKNSWVDVEKFPPLRDTIFMWLDALGINVGGNKSTDEGHGITEEKYQKRNIGVTINNLVQRAIPSSYELNSLSKIIFQTIRELKNKK